MKLICHISVYLQNVLKIFQPAFHFFKVVKYSVHRIILTIFSNINNDTAVLSSETLHSVEWKLEVLITGHYSATLQFPQSITLPDVLSLTTLGTLYKWNHPVFVLVGPAYVTYDVHVSDSSVTHFMCSSGDGPLSSHASVLMLILVSTDVPVKTPFYCKHVQLDVQEKGLVVNPAPPTPRADNRQHYAGAVVSFPQLFYSFSFEYFKLNSRNIFF